MSEKKSAAAVEAVMAFHIEREWRPLDGMHLGGTVCDHCRRSWPCRTVQAITAALEGEE